MHGRSSRIVPAAFTYESPRTGLRPRAPPVTGDGFLRKAPNARGRTHERSWDRGLQAAIPQSMCRAYCLHRFARAVLRRSTERMMMGVKVFTATKAKERELLGEAVTRWLADNPRARVTDKIVTQSSDSQFHCLSITLFYEVS